VAVVDEQYTIENVLAPGIAAEVGFQSLALGFLAQSAEKAILLEDVKGIILSSLMTAAAEPAAAVPIKSAK